MELTYQYTSKLASHFGYPEVQTLTRTTTELPPVLAGIQVFERFKAETAQQFARQQTELAEQEQLLFRHAQRLIHLPFDAFSTILFRRAPGVVTFKSNWDWTNLHYVTPQFREWDTFINSIQADCTISLKYKPEMQDFVCQSHRRWYFILDSFMECESACLTDFAEALQQTPGAAKMTRKYIDEKLFTSFKYLVYWGFLERV
ncbi:hypothetical protein [Spirosoma linguale]|uniref:Uncharacterized protein n=1 Tax=Spirosoma linguale (strain ATCC 33905 / DSM 74 / LMG 10896 / Claus 1) TaxID=504472 RepID=D2QPM1_SPILD|nr:hypothetical protein Slin_4702 [Spirosoma linguale DSM 74]